MKKLFLIATLAAALFATEKAQAQLNLHVGYTPEFIKTYTPTSDTTLFFHGLSIGLDWAFVLTDNLSLTVGAQYRINMKETSVHNLADTIFVHEVYNDRQNLIDIPILLKYNIPVSNTVTISPFVGPILSWGVKGTTTKNVTYPNNTQSQYNWYESNGLAYRPNSRFNVYAKAGVEFSFKRFNLSIGGRYGFLDLNKRNTGTATKAYGFFASFGHCF